jgi:hypothetical protein
VGQDLAARSGARVGEAGLGGSTGADSPKERRVGVVLTVKIRQPSHEFTFGVGMSFISYPLVLTPVV